jgi:hypothetical protein
MDDHGISPETRHVLERADRVIEESIRLRKVSAEFRRGLRLTRYEMERQLAHSRLSKASFLAGLFAAMSTHDRR